MSTAQTWFGYAAVQAYALACETAKTTDSKAVARALTNMALPLDIRMQPQNRAIPDRTRIQRDNDFEDPVRICALILKATAAFLMESKIRDTPAPG